jgi:hypothetical protein
LSRGTADGPRRGGSIAAEPAAPRAKVGENTRWLLLAILGLGLLVRLLHFWAITRTAFPKIPLVFTQSDMYAFFEWAQTILAGDWLGRDTYHPYFEWMKAIAPLETWYRWWGGKEIFHQAPLYPYWVAGLLALSGKSLAFVLFIQLLVSALQPLALFWLARRLFDERVGLVVAALTALYGPFIFHAGLLLRDWLLPILDTLALLALLRARDSGRGRAWVMAGMALGVSYVTKSAILLFLPLVLLWLGLEHRKAWRRGVVAGACVGVGFLLCLSPVVVRNALVGTRLFAIETRAAEGFILGNAADGSPVILVIPASMQGILERSEGRPLAVIRETLKTYQGDLRQVLRVQLLKLRGIVNPYEVQNNENFYYGREISPVLWFTLLYGIVFPLGVTGMLLARPAGPKQRLLLLYALASLIGLWLPPIRARYRLILVPVLIVFAAAFLVWFYHLVRRREIARALRAAALCLGVAFAQHGVLALRGQEYYDRRQEYIFSKDVYVSQGQFDRAAAEMGLLLEKARQIAPLAGDVPRYETEYRQLLARHLIEQGARAEARQQVELALAAHARAPHSPSYLYFNFGVLHLLLNEPEKAKPFLRRFLELEPGSPRAEQLRRILSQLDGSPR